MQDIQRQTRRITERNVYFELHRLAGEKHRLENEVLVLQKRKQKIETRLNEIDSEMEKLHQMARKLTGREGAAPPVRGYAAPPLHKRPAGQEHWALAIIEY
jgi:predicted nuclease with TOPRIM domain